ncbi:MAG: MBL fold metallo-hydrolase [Chloroflexi bacterium]|nr:MAG: MBL fold metallo-hydrolase [Chloroflexota bacterium]
MTTDLALTEVAPGVHCLSLPIPFEEGAVNIYLLRDGAHLDLIDCGMNVPESMAMMRAAIERVGGKPRRLVITHIHPDHYGAAGPLVEEFGVELYLHRLEVPLVHPRYLELETLVAEVGRHLSLHGVPAEEVEALKNASRNLRNFVAPAEADVQLDGAETLELGGRRLLVEWTPGHSPGHICLFDAENELLFSGDQLLAEISPNIALHPQSTPNPLDDYVAALRRLAARRPRLVFPAHGRPFEDPEELVDGLIAHHERRKERILGLIGAGQMSGWDVALGLWGYREELWERRLALQEGLAHLQSLAVAGQLEKLASPEAVTWRRPR